MRQGSVGTLTALAAAVGLVACGPGGSASSSSGSGASSAGAGGMTSGSGTGSTGSSSSGSGPSSGSTGVSSSGSGGATYGTCAKGCAMAVDCCTPGAMNCPSPQYPNNVTCDKGACQPPQCGDTSDCKAISPKLDCFTIGGAKSCAFACAADGDCTAPQTCSGVDANGKKFCLSSGGGCANDAACAGFGKCVDHACHCEIDADCTKPGFNKCAR